MKKYLIAFVLLGSFIARSQTISTFAGCGIMCTGLGDGGPATSAVLIDPAGGIFDKYGTYYFVEGTGQRVRKVDTNGIITTIAGTGSSGTLGDGGAATAAHFSTPSAVKIDTSGNIYISDNTDSRVRKINVTTGIVTTIAGNGTGALYGDGLPATAAEIFGPEDICFDKKGNLYIADAFNYRIRKVNTLGIISTFAGMGFSPLGSGDGGPATAATFSFLSSVIADDSGNIYIGDESANTVRKVDTFGIITNFAGNTIGTYMGDGIPATAAQISPVRLAIDSSGNLIIADRYNERVFRVDHAGIIHSIAGIGGSGTYSGDGGPATAASFDVGGISFDACWNLYISDVDNRRIRKVTYNPTCDPYSHDAFDSTSLAVATVKEGAIRIYPNPAYSSVTITAANNINTIAISNIVGQTVLYKKCNSQKETLNIAPLPQGLYTIKVTTASGSSTISKIIKQ